MKYKRNQAEWACWNANTLGQQRQIPQVFLTRIKRLLELDRAPLDDDMPGAAFSDSPTPLGKGNEALFSEFDVFCLAIGLDLLDLGFKQSEVVFLLRHIRPSLAKKHLRIKETSSVHGRNRYGITKTNGVYLIIRKVEIREFYSRIPEDHRDPIALLPIYCFGNQELAESIQDLANHDRKCVVVELAKMTAILGDLLPKAPVITRGRR